MDKKNIDLGYEQGPEEMAIEKEADYAMFLADYKANSEKKNTYVCSSTAYHSVF